MKLKYYRTALGISQLEAAGLLGVNAVTYNRYECEDPRYVVPRNVTLRMDIISRLRNVEGIREAIEISDANTLIAALWPKCQPDLLRCLGDEPGFGWVKVMIGEVKWGGNDFRWGMISTDYREFKRNWKRI